MKSVALYNLGCKVNSYEWMECGKGFRKRDTVLCHLMRRRIFIS